MVSHSAHELRLATYIVTSEQYNGLESSNPDSGKNFFLLLNAQTDSGCLLNPLISGYWVYYKAVKQLGRKVDHSSVSRAMVKNEWSYTSTPPVSQGVAKTNLFLTFYCFCVYKTYSLLLTTDPI